MKPPAVIRLGSVSGIPIELHPSFALLWALTLWAEDAPLGPGMAIHALGIVALILASVLLHELGHAFVARRHGVRTLSITFYPAGGVARMASFHVPPAAELRIALAGPAVSIALAAVCWSLAELLPEAPSDFAQDAAVLNLVIGIFNLIPAFPLDGGRILRAALALRMPYRKATRLSMGIGHVFALGLIGLGPWVSPLWLVLGAFLILLLGIERGNLRLHEALDRAHVADAMSPAGAALDPAASLKGLALPPEGPAYLVAVEPSSGHFLGLLRRSSLETALAAGHEGNLAPFLLRTLHSTHPAATLGAVIPAMERLGQDAVPVLFGRSVVGVLSWTDLHRFALAEIARLRSTAPRRSWWLP